MASASPSPIYPSSLSSFAVPPSTILAENPHLTSLAVGAFIFQPTTSKILLIRRSLTEPAFPDLWEVPGGGAELSDATLLDAVVREVKEETGLTVTAVAENLGWLEFPGRCGRMWRKYNFLVEAAGDVTTDPAEHSEWAWCGEEDVGALKITTEEQRACVVAAFKRMREMARS